MNLLESAGFSRSNPYYIVKQGKVQFFPCWTQGRGRKGGIKCAVTLGIFISIINGLQPLKGQPLKSCICITTREYTESEILSKMCMCKWLELTKSCCSKSMANVINCVTVLCSSRSTSLHCLQIPSVWSCCERWQEPGSMMRGRRRAGPSSKRQVRTVSPCACTVEQW